jgi:hypothetical protein
LRTLILLLSKNMSNLLSDKLTVFELLAH